MYCTHCGHPIAAGQRHCSHCGYRQPHLSVTGEPPSLSYGFLYVLVAGLVGLLVLLFLIVSNLPQPNSNYDGVTVIERLRA